MSLPSTHFEREAEDQSLLYFSGTLDRQAAEDLYEKALLLTRQGYPKIQVNMQRCGLVLAEGILALAEKSHCEGQKDSPCALWLTHLPEELMRSLQIYGLPVQNRRLHLPLPCKGMARDAGFVLKKCKGCGAVLRVRQAGAHLCPRCGVQLQVS